MILKLRGIDPRGVARLNQFIRSRENIITVTSIEPHSSDARVKIPVEQTFLWVGRLKSHVEEKNDSRIGNGNFLSVEFTVMESYLHYEFSQPREFEELGFAVRQQTYRVYELPAPRELPNMIFDCLGNYPRSLDEPSLFYCDGHLGEIKQTEFERVQAMFAGIDVKALLS